MKHRIRLSYRGVRKAAFFYLMLPALIFLVTFLKPMFAIPTAMVLVLIYVYSAFLRGRHEEPGAALECAPIELILVVLAALLWAVFSGQGGFMYQTSDWNERNAVFRDLITNRWPVYYPRTRTVLTYYLGHWLPAATLGKAVYVITGSLDMAWRWGNILLMLWTALGLGLCFLLLFNIVWADSPSKRLWALIIMVFFSGLDVIGTGLSGGRFSREYMTIMHLEWWSEAYQFSSISTCLFWVFNQAVPAWVATLCFLNENERGVEPANYGFILIAALICSPLPCIGLMLYMLFTIAQYGVQCLKKHRFGEWLRHTFSPGNLGMAILIFPFIGAYLLSNAAVEGKSKAANAMPAQLLKPGFVVGYTLLIVALMLLSRSKGLRRRLSDFGTQRLRVAAYLCLVADVLIAAIFLRVRFSVDYPLFIMAEAGVYLLLLYPFCMEDFMFYATALILGITPLVRVGIAMDFCMRASIPAITVLMVYCCGFVLHSRVKGRSSLMKACRVALILALLVGACTPLMEFSRAVVRYDERGTADQIVTLNKYHRSGGIYGNFVSDSYEQSLFFSRFAKALDKGASRK